jgi:hypothetical protein
VRLSLIDLLLWAAFAFFGFALVRMVVPSGRFPEYVFLLFQLGAAVVAYVFGASLIYRRMLFWPMLSPICPHCGRRPQSIDIAGTWPVFTMSCGLCDGQTELRMGKVKDAAEGRERPCLQLKWPYFLGWYKRIR